MNADTKKAIQVDASIRGGFLSSNHTALVGVMDRVGQRPQNTPPRIHALHEGYNTSSGNAEISPNPGYIPTSDGPFGRPSASGGLGGDGGIVSGSQQPTLGGRPPMAGGIGGTSKSRNEETEKLSKFDKLMSLVKRNGIWPASEGKAVLCCLMEYITNFDAIFEDVRSKIEAVDLILTLLALAALEKYEIKNQIEWERISMKGKTKLAAKNIDADAEIKALLKII
ncbi:unnamed protein product [Oikopleura dioica]|nr:unnamed protein product [Oikopleura dioica]